MIMNNILFKLLLMVFDVSDNLLFKDDFCLVINYHQIIPSDVKYSVDKGTFINQIKYLRKKYRVCNKENFFSNRKSAGMTNRKALITFDDGIDSIYTISDYLNKNKIKPILFINHTLLGKSVGGCKIISKSKLNKLIKMGWNIGNHGAEHMNFISLSRQDLIKQIKLDKFYYETNCFTDCLAYPNGTTNKSIISEVKKQGYKYAFTTGATYFRKKYVDLFRIPRLNIKVSDHLLLYKLKVSPTFLFIKSLIKHA